MVVPFFLPVIGGMETHAHELGLELTARGHKVEILTANMDHSGSRAGKQEEMIDGILVRRYPVWLRLGKFASFWPRFVSDLSRYDIIHVQSMRQPHTDLGLVFGKLNGKKVVFSTQSPLHKGTHGRLMEIAILAYDNIVLPLISRFYDCIYAHHQAEKEYLVAHGVPERLVRVVHLGVGREAFREWPGGFFKKIRRRGGKILLFVGRLSNMKGLDLLLRAFSIAGKKHRNWQLVLVGPDGGELDKLKRLQAELGVRNVHFWGTLTEGDVEKACADADLFVLPSIYEPYGLVLIKAMAKGVPAIAMDRGGPTEIIKDGKTGLLSKYDPKSLSACMELLFSDDKLRKRMGASAKKWSRKFTLKKMVDEYERSYLEVLKGG